VHASEKENKGEIVAMDTWKMFETPEMAVKTDPLRIWPNWAG
jgi:hypothetical protein